MRFRQLLQKGIVSLIGVVLIGEALVLPSVAQAQADAPPIIAANQANRALDAAAEVKDSALAASVFFGLINLTTFAVNRASYDLAVMLASGAAGEDPLVEFRTPGEYALDYGAAVAGEAVGTLSETLSVNGVLTGFNLCVPGASAAASAEIIASINLGIKSAFERPKPKCDWNAIGPNWQGFMAQIATDFQGVESIFKNEEVLTQLAGVFDPTANEFSVGVTLYSDILSKSIFDSRNATNRLLEGGTTKDVVDAITGNIKTPAQYINYQSEFDWTKGRSTPYDLMEMFANNDKAFLQLGMSGVSTFANTFITQLTSKLYTGLFDFNSVRSVDPFSEGLLASSNRSDAQQRFRALLTASPVEVSNYSILSDFASCPTSSRGLYNCVLDSSFSSAVARAGTGIPLTVQEAIEQELIDGNWPLIPASDKSRDQDPYCYTYGFCHSNLVKLRKARIIPTGWELAAESTWNRDSSPVTLQEAINGFDNCNENGQIDETHPWCKLVDPNWVLKYPETQCKNLAYGQLLETSASADRQQECVDMPSCIDENADGTCAGYGYCVREENVWDFRGESCPEYASSCLSFEDSEGDEANLLLNTVDYSDCDESNAGCTWYATEQELQTDGTFAWPTVSDVATADAAGDTYASRIYFNANVETCDEENGGCTELVERDDSLRLNVLANSSFEDDTDTNDLPDVWQFTDSSESTYDTTGEYSLNGDAAVNPGNGLVYQPGIVLEQGSFYTLSYYARQGDGSTDSASMIVALTADDGSAVSLRGTSYTDGCSIYSADGGATFEYEVMEVVGAVSSTEYERFDCTFTVPSLTDSAAKITAIVDLMPGDVWIDDIQLEQAEDASEYHDGYSDSSLTLTYAKVPPSYLGCEGDENDPAECEDYAQVCREVDVGCNEYSPANGDPAVFGIASALDACPASCVGYDTYKQEATLYEPEGDFPVYFIPATAEACQDEEVGCDEFTNLGDESLNYFTYLRACVTPDQAAANAATGDEGQTFYTWEGSDSTGYQLVTWTLLESDLDEYATSVYDGSGDTETSPGEAPCTTWVTSDDGITCNDNADSDSSGHFDSDTDTCDEHDDIFTNPNCREFYDADGDIHYRDWSLTVTVNEACASYRKSDLVGLGSDSNLDGIDDGEANCTASGGYFDTLINACRYYGYSEESTSCSENANGCRAYSGGRSRNSRVALEETFEGGDLTNWDAASAASVTYSNESIATDGHSLASVGEAVWTFVGGDGTACDDGGTGDGCAESGVSLGGTCTVVDGEEWCGTLNDELYVEKTYSLSFWAKGDANIAVGFDINADTAAIALTSEDAVFSNDGTTDYLALSTSGWEQYSLGPLNMTEDDFADFGNGTVLAFIPENAGDSFYIDNIVLREGEDSITVIKDSWVTPAACDETPTGTSSPQYYLGCQEYTTQDNDTAYLKSFSSLCAEDVVGCEDYFTTAESESPYAEVYGATCSRLSTDVTSAVSCYYSQLDAAYDTTSPYLCTIGVGQESCEFNMDWYVPAANLPAHISYTPSTHVVPADASRYFVVDSEDECDSSEKGCMEVGLPTFSQDRSEVTASTSTFLLNIPDDYADILCAHGDLFCEEWNTETDGTYYFKDPGNQTCEYRTDVMIDSVSYSGWFRTDSDEFCYGTGTCTESRAACSTDADCGVSGGECAIDTGSYLIGGVESGIWRNGDDAYANWSGTCEAEYSTCAEFQDLLQVAEGDMYGESDGESYFYLDNDSLEESTLVSSQQCNGQVSQKLGCALFNDTTDTGQDYNASASYIASVHADELFGESEFSLVDPISCDDAENSTIVTPSGESVDLCAQRCVYRHDDIYDVSDNVPLLSLDEASGEVSGKWVENEASITAGGDLVYELEDMYVFGTSCYESDDCAPQASELGQNVVGTCETDVTIYATTDGFETEDVPRFDDDSNRVLKVNRDRECSEWLTCANSQQVWDERTGSYRTICEDIDLCNDYAGAGNSSFCSAWNTDDIPTILDEDRYTSRDVSWYGHDYSGYGIPDLLPVQMLTQENVAPPPGYCDLSPYYAEDDATFIAYQGDECTGVVLECGEPSIGVSYCVQDAETDYRLVYNAGACDEVYGASCTVGYCEDTGAVCSASSQCGGSTCVVGTCYAVSSVDCTQENADTACGTGEVCLESGKCAADNGLLAIGEACASGDTLFTQQSAVMTGTCIRESCLVTPGGVPLDLADTEAKACRAYPESNSPFDNEVVSYWRNPNPVETVVSPFTDVLTNLEEVMDMEPYSFLTNFDNVEWCAGGEDCTCSYKKISYGQNGQEIRYYDDEYSVDQTVGICAGGGFDGSYCSKGVATIGGSSSAAIPEEACERGWDGDTDSAPDDGEKLDGTSDITGGGTCIYPTQEDTILGLDGYCLERDTAINVNGNRDDDHRACINWLPVDQLAGSTDLYAKYLNAGYNGGDTQYCAFQEEYVDIGVSGIDETVYLGSAEGDEGTPPVACAEQEGSLSTCDGRSAYECDDNVQCPEGYYGVVSACIKYGEASTLANAAAYTCIDETAGDNDCPYVCVPDNAWQQQATATDAPTNVECEDGLLSAWGDQFDLIDEGGWNGDVKLYVHTGNFDDFSGYSDFNTIVSWLGTCQVKGLAVSEAESLYATDTGLGNSLADYESGGDGYYNVQFAESVITYDACSVLVAADYDQENYAWTDRILNAARDYSPYSDYLPETAPVPFGATLPVDSIGDGDGYPFIPDTEDDEARSYYASGDGLSDVLARINNIFAKFTGAHLFVSQADERAVLGQLGEYDYTTSISSVTTPGGVTGQDFRGDVRAAEGNPPTVRALDMANCDGTECEEDDLHNLTLNATNEGDVTGAHGFLRAYLKFYAAADKNQLPIRRVIVDWGDGSSYTGSETPDNYFKNHRGFQENTTISICDTDPSSEDYEWGMSEESCDPNYFSYNHVYTCNVGTIDDLTDAGATCTDSDNDGSFDTSPCVQTSGIGSSCVFTPRVHVRDNWGFCTGTCDSSIDDSYDADERCFDGAINSLNSPESSSSECAYQTYPDEDPTIDPWVYYNGAVYVTP